MAFHIDDIVNQEFSRAFLGYDIQEVDVFLDTLIDRFEKLEAQRKEMLIAMEYLLKKLEETSDLSDDMKKALAKGDKTLRRLTAAVETQSEPARERKQISARKRGEGPDRTEQRRVRRPERQPVKTAALKDEDEYTTSDRTTSKQDIPASEPVVSSAGSTAVRVGRTLDQEAVAGAATAVTSAFAALMGRTQTTSEQETNPQQARAGASEPVDAQANPQPMGTDPAGTASAPVAIEMETQEDAPDMDMLIPELLSDLESALTDDVIRAASSTKKETPERTDKPRVS